MQLVPFLDLKASFPPFLVPTESPIIRKMY